ncbi:undecaprenyl-phosphate glucose phosphotransferase [Trinickia dabaoshanensis]|uniref:Undecaprenyl-phosphate glucose phosphotransferase n=1 Tax=Trinickia dabaoshanensis TaxID=564714 RepID=A0A2N7VMM7_9BURK|nr:undecaprenyl-phosphate glucose phosphotransferase [Trinickia dabaoshanensis]PMS18365.1 undecaprenyl-phosphate glucose phosphotransferase [Trinickia dabaoshanensis]
MRGLQDLWARVFDVGMIVLGALIASQLRFEDVADGRLYWAFVAFSAALSLLVFPTFGVYESWRGRSKRALIRQVAFAWALVQVGDMALMFSLHMVNLVSRLWFGYWTLLTGVAIIGGRLWMHAVLARMRTAGMNLHQVAIAGCGSHCDDIIRKIEIAPTTGFRATAIYNVNPGAAPLAHPELPVFDDHKAFASFVREQDLDEVWLALPLTEEAAILKLVNEFRNDLVNIRFMPDVRTLSLFEGSVTNLLGLPTINLVASPVPPAALIKKDLFDRLFAAAALLALAPVMIAIAIAVKLSSPGPVFFKQRRKGVDGRVFTIYKFRSMRVHVPKAGVLEQAKRGDPRVTRVGAFLRRTSLDELPQFINVLRGEMSVVGPRPHAIEHDNLYQPIVQGYIHRYRIKPGITGWAQVNGFRGETERVEKMEQRVAHDLYYLRNWSFRLDMRIILATIFKGLRHTNAY